MIVINYEVYYSKSSSLWKLLCQRLEENLGIHGGETGNQNKSPKALQHPPVSAQKTVVGTSYKQVPVPLLQNVHKLCYQLS